MAGVAPQQRGGGSGASTIGMVVSIITAVVLLGALIFLFTQQEQLRSEAEQAKAARDRLATRSDENTAKQMFPDAAGPNKTLVGEMLRGVQLLCGSLTGNQNDTPLVAAGKLQAALARIIEEGQVPDPEQISGAYGAVAVIERLYQLYLDQQARMDSVQARLEKANTDLETALASHEALKRNLDEQLAELTSRVERLQNAKNEFETVKNQEIQALADEIKAKRDLLDSLRHDQSRMRQQFAAQVSKRERLLREQREALMALKGAGPEGARELAIARKPIGTVLRALPGDSLVHIDLGRRDNVTLGMTFSVYSADERVPVDGRGKAAIEVVSLGERTSECRVVTQPSPDDPILEGDRVGNIVLSRNRAKKQRFCVVGRFDVDFDGRPDVLGAEAIKALIERYGGQMVASVDAMTDYVVVGLEPPVAAGAFEPDDAGEKDWVEADEVQAYDEGDEVEDEDWAEDENADELFDHEDEDEADEALEDDAEEHGAPGHHRGNADVGGIGPRLGRRAEVDPTRIPRRRRVLSERERYEEALRRAELLSIPRLPQDRFFNFIGIENGPVSARRLQR